MAVVAENPRLFTMHWITNCLSVVARLPLLASGIQPNIIRDHTPVWLASLLTVLYVSAGLFLMPAVVQCLRNCRSVLEARVFLRPECLVWPGFFLVYGATISMAFVSFRFLVVLMPALGVPVARIIASFKQCNSLKKGAIGTGLLVMSMGTFSAVAYHVYLNRLQAPGMTVEQVLTADGSLPEEPIGTNSIWQYQVGSRRNFVELPREMRSREDLLSWAREQEIRYLVFQAPNIPGDRPGTRPDIMRFMFGDNPPGRVLYRQDDYLKVVVIRIDVPEPGINLST